MSDSTSKLGLPLLAAGQAQKHVTVNESLIHLDSLVQLSVLDREHAAPPADPDDGDRYVVASGATGAWAGKTDAIAVADGGAWLFLIPQEGWLCWDVGARTLLGFADGEWAPAGGAEIENLTRFGLGTIADSTNPFSAKLNAALWTARTTGEGGNGDLRYLMNKEAPADVLSLLLQSAYSGRAEIGLVGDDDLAIKVSPDGSTWREALRVDRASGRPTFPQGGVREQLTANRTYFVRADGSDGNNGRADTASGAFLTLQKAYDVIASTVDLAGFIATISIGSGTFAGVNIAVPWIGGNLTIQGAGTSLTTLSGTTHLVRWSVPLPGSLTVKAIKLTTTSAGDCIHGNAPGRIAFETIEFAAAAGRHIAMIAPGARAECSGNYGISGGAQAHWHAEFQSLIQAETKTITLTGSPAFSSFANATAGVLAVSGNTLTGSATGARYAASANGVIRTNGGGASYLPGSASGSASSGGQYL